MMAATSSAQIPCRCRWTYSGRSSAGGGLPPVADPPGGPVDGAGAGALDAAASLAAGADRAAPGPAFDVAGALALGAGAERGQVQEPHPGGEDGEHGEDQVRVHDCSP